MRAEGFGELEMALPVKKISTDNRFEVHLWGAESSGLLWWLPGAPEPARF